MSNLIHFKQAQLAQFDHLVQNILSNPERYLQFDSIADFYQAQWLDDFPQGTTWYATGLDDGAEHFYAKIEFCGHYLTLYSHDIYAAEFGILHTDLNN